jgi:hypothetical protein
MALFQYNLGSEIPFSSIDYGFIEESPTTPSEDHGDLEVVSQIIIAPDDIVSTYSGSLNNVTITNAGTGVGEFGGFNIARHIKFTGYGTRYFTFAFDTSNREEITFSVIRGTDFNGGELTDFNESLLFEYSIDDGTTWSTPQILVLYNDTAFNVLNDVTVTLPTAAKVSNAQFRIRQASSSGSNYDQYGIASITIESSETFTTEDYGFLTPARQTLPYGRLKIINEFADQRLLRNSVGGIVFALGGTAGVFVLPIHVGSGFFHLDGKEFTRITLRYIGGGFFSHFGGGAETVTNATPAETPLFTVAGVATERFGKGNYKVTGQFSTFKGAAEVVSINGATRQDLFRIKGTAQDSHTENYIGKGSLFGLIGSSEAIKVEDKASGLFSFKGTSKVKTHSNNAVSVEAKLFGSGTDSVVSVTTPGTGESTISGAITNEHVRYHQFGTGTLSSFRGSAETSNRVVFSYNESSVVNVETLNYGFITEGQSDDPISTYANVSISTYANEVVSEFGRFGNREDFGHISIDPEQSVNTPGHNHIDYGVINTTNRFPFGKFQSDDGGDLTYENAGIKFKVIPITPGPVFTVKGEASIFVLPVHVGTGFFRPSGTATVRIRAVYYGSGKFSKFGGASEAITNFDTAKVLFTINGNAVEKNTENYVGTGSLFAVVSNTETTSVTETPQVLYKFTGSAVEKNTEAYEGIGSLFGFVSTSEATVVQSTSSGLFSIRGSGIEKNTENYIGTGSLFGIVSKTESTVVQSVSQVLFRFTGAITNEHVRYHQFGTGSLFGLSSTSYAEKIAYDYNEESIVNIGEDNYGLITEGSSDQTISDYANDPISLYANQRVSEFGRYGSREDFGHISIDPEQSINTHGWCKDDYGLITEPPRGNQFPYGDIELGGIGGIVASLSHVGSGKFSTFGGSAEIVSQTDDTFGLFKVKGSSGIVASLAHVGSGKSRIGDSGFENFIRVLFRPPSSTTLFRFSGGLDVSGVKERESDLKATFTEVGNAELRITGDAFTTFHLGHLTTGQFFINGNAVEKNTEDYVGSGSLFGFSGGAESLTIDIPETATLFRFVGNGIEKNTENYVGTGSLFGIVSKTESTTNAEQPKVLFNIEGASVNRVRFHYYGSGKFSTFTGAAEARAVVKQAGGLFTFNGNAPESVTPAPHVGSGSLFAFVGKTEAFAASDDFAPSLFKIGGDGIIGFSLGIIGRGGFDVLQKVTKLDVEGKNRFVGAQERRAVNNPASVLFSINGKVKIFFVYQEVGGGFIRPTGTAFTEVTPIHKGSGRTSISGDSTIGITMSQIGSGTIFGFIGGAEATAVDAPPREGLLRFAGTAPEKIQRGPEIGTASLQIKSSDVFVRFNLSHIADGSQIHVNGDGAEARVRLYEGSGSLFGFTGATESRVIDLPPQVPTLFRFAGNSEERETNAHQGTGSLFGFDSATEVRTASPELSGLFKVQGTVAEAKTKVFTGSGTFDLNTKKDGIDVSGKQVYISAPESTTVNPPEETQVFSFSGSAIATEDRAFRGTGTLFGFTGASESRRVAPESTGLFKVQGSGEESRTRLYSGSGTIFGFIGGAEATAVVETPPGSLFKFTGEVVVIRRFPPHIGSGTLFSFTGATESLTIAPPVATLFEFNGNVDESRSRVYQGSGTLVTFQSATLARRVPYNVTQGLFRLVGVLNESFVPSGYVGTTGVQFIGASADRRIEFQEPKPTQIYIV